MCSYVSSILAVLLFWVLAVPSNADEIAESLGLTRDTGSLPLWEEIEPEAKDRLDRAARDLRAGVYLVGTAKGGHGTAFLISKEHRLLATNAHVADILHNNGKMLAIHNESTTVYEIESVWYHPGVLRILDKATMAVGRSVDPAVGSVFPRSADVAVVELKAGGPELPDPLTLAAPDQLDTLFAQPIAVLGFPGHDTKSWPGIGERPQATFHDGVISRTTNFQLDNSTDSEDRQLLQHTAVGLGGFSGSPIFISDGTVVGLHNSFRVARDRGAELVLSHGVRIDCLWELLAFNKLTDKVPIPLESDDLKLGRFSKLDPMVAKYRQANELAAVAKAFVDQEKFSEGSQRAAAALKIVPNHPESLYQLQRASANYAAIHYRALSTEVRRQQFGLAEKYAKRLVKVAPSDPRSMLTLLMAMSNIATETVWRDKRQAIQEQSRVVQATTMLLNSNRIHDDWNRAYAYHIRSAAKSNLVLNRGGRDLTDALLDNSEAIRLNPESPIFPDERADMLEMIGRRTEARQWRERAKNLRER